MLKICSTFHILELDDNNKGDYSLRRWGEKNLGRVCSLRGFNDRSRRDFIGGKLIYGIMGLFDHFHLICTVMLIFVHSLK